MIASAYTQRALKYCACAQNVSDVTHGLHILRCWHTPRRGVRGSQVPRLRTECAQNVSDFSHYPYLLLFVAIHRPYLVLVVANCGYSPPYLLLFVAIHRPYSLICVAIYCYSPFLFVAICCYSPSLLVAICCSLPSLFVSICCYLLLFFILIWCYVLLFPNQIGSWYWLPNFPLPSRPPIHASADSPRVVLGTTRTKGVSWDRHLGQLWPSYIYGSGIHCVLKGSCQYLLCFPRIGLISVLRCFTFWDAGLRPDEG